MQVLSLLFQLFVGNPQLFLLCLEQTVLLVKIIGQRFNALGGQHAAHPDRQCILQFRYQSIGIWFVSINTGERKNRNDIVA